MVRHTKQQKASKQAIPAALLTSMLKTLLLYSQNGRRWSLLSQREARQSEHQNGKRFIFRNLKS